MTGSVFLKTLRDMRESVLVWSLGLAALGAANVLLFPAFVRMPGLVAFLDNLPPAIKAMVGDVRAMALPEGFLRVKLFEPLPLLLAIFGVPHGARLIAGEIEDRSVDLLMAQPIRRWRVVAEKFLAVACALVVLAAALAAAVVACAPRAAAGLQTGHLVLASLNALPLTWLFTALALLASCAAAHARRAGLIGGGVVVASYVFESLRLLTPALAGWWPLSPFAHFKASYPPGGAFAPGPALLLLGVTALLLAAAAAVWERRDLTG